ncbi:hypothetical protein Tco_0438047 [Tanacetum coccineum]
MAKMIDAAIQEELRSYMSGHILHVHPAQPTTIYAQEQQYQLYLSMKDDLQLQQEDIAIWLALKIKFERLHYQLHCNESGQGSHLQDNISLSCQRDPEAPILSLINQDLLYLKKGSSGSEKIVLSLHKFPAVIFNDDDIEERTSRWVNKCVKKFNPYARYGVKHWKNPHAKIFYIRKQKELEKAKEVVYSNSKIIQPDFKNLNKNDIKDMYLLIMNGKVPDYAETGLLWSLSVFIRSLVIWERVHDFQLGPVFGIIYKNSKKENRVMRHSEVHKFCDVTLSYNNDVKYGYIQRELTKEDVEYLQLFEEQIDERLKHRNQMRHWEIFHITWDIIFNGDLQEEAAPESSSGEQTGPPAPKTVKQLAAKRNQERVKSI